MAYKVWFILRKDNANRIVDQDAYALAAGTDFVHVNARHISQDAHDEWMSGDGGNCRKAIIRVDDLAAIQTIAKELRNVGVAFEDIQIKTGSGLLFCGIVIYPTDEANLPKVLRKGA